MQSGPFDLANGFLPNQDPLLHLSAAFSEWESLAQELPKLLVSDKTRQTIDQLPAFPYQQLQSLEEYERAMLILSYLGHAYVWNNKKPTDAIPESLATAWYQVATRLGRPPVLSYASYALYNWSRLDKNRGIELGNIALAQNFLGGVDEEWFILIHIDIEAKAAPGIAAILPAQQAVRNQDDDALQQQLALMVQTLTDINTSMDRMPEHCDPYIYYHRVRPYIHGWKANPALPNGLLYNGVTEYQQQPQKFKGETGAQSSIVPSFDAALDIEHEDNPLKEHLNEMRLYMPPQHVEFINTVEQGASIRQFILDNAHNNSALRDLYNQCIHLLDRFRQTHFQ